MSRFGYLKSRIPFTSDPCLYDALLWELTMLPQDDPDVLWAIKHVRGRLAAAQKQQLAHRRSVVPGGPGVLGIIENGPCRYDSLEKHRAHIASLKSLPQENETVRRALERAYQELAGAITEEAFFESGKRRPD
jgi:hypothetical protein